MPGRPEQSGLCDDAPLLAKSLAAGAAKLPHPFVPAAADNQSRADETSAPTDGGTTATGGRILCAPTQRKTPKRFSHTV